METLRWIEASPLSVFVREDLYAYSVLLIVHAGAWHSWSAAVSLLSWIGLIAAGRVITAFRLPSWFGCAWCG